MALIAEVTSPHNAGGPHGSKRGGKDQCLGPQVDVNSWPTRIFRKRSRALKLMRRINWSRRLADLYRLLDLHLKDGSRVVVSTSYQSNYMDISSCMRC